VKNVCLGATNPAPGISIPGELALRRVDTEERWQQALAPGNE